MLKILHVISGDLWAGAEAQAYTLMTSLARMSGVRVAAAVMNEGELASRLRQAEVEVFVLHEQNRGPLSILLRLRELMEAWRPSVVHTHREKENILGAIACWSTLRAPSVRTVHGGPENHEKLAGFRAVRNWLIKSSDNWCARSLQSRVIVVSGELAKRMSSSFPLEKMVIIENGVDSDAVMANVRAADFRTVEPDCTHIGIVGRLVDVKRVDLFLHAAAILSRSVPQRPWRFHVLGDGPLRAALESVSSKLELASVVTFHGHRRDITSCMAGLDVLVMCSDHEGMPMTALEAAAIGIPLVAHAVGALPEIVPEEFLVNEQTSDAYANRVRRALQSDGRAIASMAARRVLERFSAEGNACRVRALYEHVIGERETARRGAH